MNKSKKGKLLTIQLTSEFLRIALIDKNAAEPVMEVCGEYVMPENAVSDGTINDMDAVRELLTEVLKDERYCKVQKAIFTLCSSQVLTETASMPAKADGANLEKAIMANIDMFFPVDISDRILVWKKLGKTEGAEAQLLLQLWAVPREMAAPYYQLANDCGLSLIKLDYFAVSAAAAAKLRYGVEEKAKKPLVLAAAGKKSTAAAETEQERGSELYVYAEGEHVIMSFAENGQVRMQRLLPNEGELFDAAMVLDYYKANYSADDIAECFVSGKNGLDEGFLSRISSVLGIEALELPHAVKPEWHILFGAAYAETDFGIPSLNHPATVLEQLKDSWEVAALAAGAALLAIALTLTVGTNIIWNRNIDSLKTTQASLQEQSLKTAGFADNYYEYENMYDAYSADWDALFGSMHTYNDNLTEMLNEIEGVVPKKSKVETIAIAGEGLALEFSCTSKEEAAYLIIALRQLENADLLAISNLTYGGAANSNNVTASAMLPSLAAKLAEDAAKAAENASAADTNNEQPPESGTHYDIGALIDIIEEITGKTEDPEPSPSPSPSPNPSPSPSPSPNPVNFTEEDMENAIWSISLEQLDVIEDTYAPLPKIDYKAADLIQKTSVTKREAAIKEMLNNDKIAQCRFYLLFKDDMQKQRSQVILYNTIAEDLWADKDLVNAAMSQDIKTCREAIPDLVDILLKDNKSIKATEKLMLTDERMAARYAYYLAVELGYVEKDENVGKLNTEELAKDINNNGTDLANPDEKVDDAITALLPALLSGTYGGDNAELVEKLLKEYLGLDSDSELSVEELLKKMLGGDTDNGGSVSGVTSASDGRYHFAVALGYKDSLINGELERKGMLYSDKLPKLEVD